MQTQAPKATMQDIPLSLIDITRNPRRYFDKSELDTLIQSVISNGVQTPILVRPSSQDGRYELIAGERRVRAAKAVYGHEGFIPARIQAMSDEEAERAALIENTVRADMSASEESDAAHKITESCKGDRDEAAKLLGWPRAKLDSRLGLQNLCEEVKVALDSRLIKLGHAELLAATPMEKQEAALSFILENKPSIDEVRSMMEQFALNLKTAIFDKTDCTDCVYNSAQQSTLFESSVSDGHCTNKPCFEKKTSAKLISTQNELLEVYPTVKITDSPSSLGAIKVTVEHVGQDQIAGCKTCENFGAVVSSNPTEIGEVYVSQCFDSVCFGKKRMALQEQINSTQSESSPKDQELDADEDGEQAQPQKIAKPRAKAKKGDHAGSTEKKDSSTAKSTDEKGDSFSPEKTKDMAISTRIQNYRREVWNNIFAQYFVRNPENAKRVFMALALQGKLSKPSLGADTKAEKWVAGVDNFFTKIDGTSVGLGAVSYNDSPVLASENVSAEQINRLAAFMVASKVKDTFNTKEDWLAELAIAFDVRYSDFAKVDRAFFDALTKFEIQAVCYEAGYTPSDESVSIDSLMNKKKGEVLDTLLDGSFDWKGFSPDMLGLNKKKWTLVPKQVTPAS